MIRACDKPPNHWSVYMIEASDGTLYTGITVDIKRRWQEHLTGKNGAKYFRGRVPSKLRFFEVGHNRSSASQREAAIKKMNRKQKEQLIRSMGKRMREQLARVEN